MTLHEDGKVHTPTFGKVMKSLMHDLSITDGAKVLYAHMHWRYGSNRDNHESQESMAKMLGVSERTIRNRIDELEANDWIVTIYQERDDKKQWQRCYYHIFETQDECRDFRANYESANGDEIKEKPEARERKSRKGKGNPNPKDNRPKSGSDDSRLKPSSGGRLKSGSDGGLNPSSEELDSVYPDSSKQTQKNTTATNSSPTGDTDFAITHRQKTDLIKAWWDNTPELNRPIQVKQAKMYTYKGFISAAEEAIKRGITPEKMAAYVKHETSPHGIYHDKPLKFGTAVERAIAWCGVHYRAPSQSLSSEVPDPPLPPGMLSADPEIDQLLKSFGETMSDTKRLNKVKDSA